MHAWLCENPVGVDALTWKELPTPQPGAGQVRVRIEAASLNFPDLLIVQNKYQMKPPLPFVPGAEFAGVVEAVGDGVTHLKPGQAVACLAGTGGFATHTLAPAALCMPLPPGFGAVDAAAFIMTYATSHHALVDRAQLKAGETVLVLGAAGGVGTAAIQIAKALGARVIAAASSEDKCALCRAQGADVTINYSEHTPQAGLREAIKAATEDYIQRLSRAPRIILLENHGLIALGATPEAVLAGSLMAAKAAEIFVGAAAISAVPRFLTAEQVERIAGRPDEHYRQKALGL